jgi:hypothetical protein
MQLVQQASKQAIKRLVCSSGGSFTASIRAALIVASTACSGADVSDILYASRTNGGSALLAMGQ